MHFLYLLIQIYFKGHQLYEYIRISQQFFVRLIIRDMFKLFTGLQFYEDLQDLLELAPKKGILFIIGKVKVKLLSRVQLSETPWTVAYQASPSMGFSRQEFWSGVPLPSPRLY